MGAAEADATMVHLLQWLDGRAAVKSTDAMGALFGVYTPVVYEKTCMLLRAAGWAPERVGAGARGATLWYPPRIVEHA